MTLLHGEEKEKKCGSKITRPAGLEPAIFRSVGGRLIQFGHGRNYKIGENYRLYYNKLESI